LIKAASHLGNILDIAIAERVTPAIAAAVGTLDEATPRFLYTKGRLSYGAGFTCNESTLFDLASLTKILSTALLSARAITENRVTLNEAPFTNWASVTVREILEHTAGLPAHKNFYVRGQDRHQTLTKALSTSIDVNQRTQTLYSDIGFIALGSFLEKRFTRPLDEIFATTAKEHLGTQSLSYNSRGDFDKSKAAGTGFCPFRRRHLVGEVNDLNAFALGQVAGHAGLFGTVHDVATAARYFLKSYKRPETKIEKTLRTFMTAGGKRAIGFDRAERNGSTGGALSEATVGHLGFTGTSLWLDPKANNNKGAYFVLLTNYLEGAGRKQDILALRRAFHRAAIRLF